jgi:hypothetical protein
LNESADRQTIEGFLEQMGFGSAGLAGFEVLQSYLSGASTYRLHLRDQDAVLKLTRATSSELGRARARREVSFYRELAGAVPLQVPRVLALHTGPAGASLLLTAYQPSPAPAAWPAADYLEAARQLARLHAAFWDATAPLAAWPWLNRRHVGESTAEIVSARSAWQALHAQPRLAAVVDAATRQWLDGLLDRMSLVEGIFQALPLTLCHGDCIQANVLRGDDGQLIWADWQEVRLAHGPEDLAFFLQRATIAGAAVPEDHVWAVYHESLAAHIGQTIEFIAIRRVADAADLWSRALYWPAYMQMSAPEELLSMVGQIRVLAERLGVA